MTKKIGFIGLGTIGKPVVKNLLKAGYKVPVHNRSRASGEGCDFTKTSRKCVQLYERTTYTCRDGG